MRWLDFLIVLDIEEVCLIAGVVVDFCHILELTNVDYPVVISNKSRFGDSEDDRD